MIPSIIERRIRLFFPSLDRREALSILSMRSPLRTFIFMLLLLGRTSLYLINSPSRRRRTTFTLPIRKKAFFSLSMSFTSFSSSETSLSILLISFMILAEMTTFFSSMLTMASLVMAILYPSIAIMLIPSFCSSISIPVITPLDSSALAAKEVLRIISLRVFLSREINS